MKNSHSKFYDKSCEGAGNFITLAPVKLWTLFHLLLTLLVFNVGSNSPLKCTFGPLRVCGVQGGGVCQSQKNLTDPTFFAVIYLIEHFPHQVNGTGPLAGLYELTNSEEPRCK